MSTRIRVTVQADSLSAQLEVAEGPAATQADLDAAIAAAGLVTGLDTLLITNVGLQLRDPEFTVEELPIAMGDPGDDGEDGFFTLRFTGLKQVGTPRFDGSVDFRERFRIYRADEGDVLARYTPPTKARHGETVLGAKIRRTNGKNVKLACGPGAEFDSEENVIRATRDGMISYVADERISVLDLFAHDGDVDYESGNLRVDGSVAVGGVLLPEFKVESTGDTYIQGGNAGGSIRSGGNVAVAGGISSTNGSSVQAAGDVTCHHANNVEIVSGGTALVEDHAVDATIYGRDVRIDSGRGKMVGGRAFAHSTIRVAEAGSPHGTKTDLYVANLDRERAERKSGDAKTEGERDIGWIELDLLATAKIVVTKVVHPGVVVHFAEHRHEVLDEASDVVFRWDAEAQRIVMESQAVGVNPG